MARMLATHFVPLKKKSGPGLPKAEGQATPEGVLGAAPSYKGRCRCYTPRVAPARANLVIDSVVHPLITAAVSLSPLPLTMFCFEELMIRIFKVVSQLIA